jgi:vacuolar-type H+-ATPase subunit H
MTQAHELSALDQVRQAEAEVARRVAAARAAAEQTVARAREQAQALFAEAEEAGRREGQAHYRRLILQAQDEASAICLESQERVEELRRAEVARMEVGVRRVVAIITGSGEEGP